MVPADCPLPVPQREIIDDAGPDIVGQAKMLRRSPGQLLQFEQRGRRQDDIPNLLQIPVTELESIKHSLYIARAPLLRHRNLFSERRYALRAASFLPQRCVPLYVEEQRSEHLNQNRTHVGS